MSRALRLLFTSWVLTLLTVLGIVMGVIYFDGGRTSSGYGSLWVGLGFGCINLFVQCRALLVEYKSFAFRRSQ